MSSGPADVLDEAYQRLHATGPEFDGWLSNHGPMAAEAMARRGQADRVHQWLDCYMQRLEEFPRGTGPIGAQWREALGDPRRVADWTDYFRQEVASQPWRQVLGTWWPRCSPASRQPPRTASSAPAMRWGAAGRRRDRGSSHRTCPRPGLLGRPLAARAGRRARTRGGRSGTSRGRSEEPGEAGPEPGARAGARPAGPEPEAGPEPGPRPAAERAPSTRQRSSTVAAALAAVPRIADQTGGIRERLPRLDGLPGWRAALALAAIPASPDQTRAWLAGLADEATTRYLEYGHGNAVMLVHSATAPTAVLRTLPALREDLWAPSAAAAWAAAAALTAIYAPTDPRAGCRAARAPVGPLAAEEVFARAVDHGDEHVIKFADTAADVYARTSRPAALAAAIRAAELVPQKTA